MAKKEIFILLTHTGTLPSKIIKMYTREPYSHVSIAFDPELNEVYSFGRKCVNNPLIAGFIKEDIKGGVYAKFKNTTYELYSLKIAENQYERLKIEINKLYKRKDIYKYNFLGILGVLMNRPIGSDNSYFCSQFVAHILEKSSIKLVKKPSGLVTPGDFRRSNNLKLIHTGVLCEYNPEIVYENFLCIS